MKVGRVRVEFAPAELASDDGTTSGELKGLEGGGEKNSSYSLLEVFADGSLKLRGFRTQVDRGFWGK